MKIKVLLLCAAASLWAHGAVARQIPNPPPSGIVIHLFGPGSVTSRIMPTGTVSHTAQGHPGVPGSAGASTSGTGADNYVEPSTGEVLHQMFISGDPDRKVGDGFAKGRSPRSDLSN